MFYRLRLRCSRVEQCSAENKAHKENETTTDDFHIALPLSVLYCKMKKPRFAVAACSIP